MGANPTCPYTYWPTNIKNLLRKLCYMLVFQPITELTNSKLEFWTSVVTAKRAIRKRIKIFYFIQRNKIY
jgi:hypothetical protein